MRRVAWIIPALFTAAASAQADTVDALREARTPAEVVRIVNDWIGGPDVATWYIKSGESGGGTSSSDYAGSWADISSSVGPDDTVYVHGDSVLEETIEIADAGVTFAAEPGTGRWTQTGRRPVDAGDWAVHTAATPSAGNIYKVVTGATAVGFVYDYRLGVAEGVPSLYIGHLPKTAETTLANFVTDVQNNARVSWFYNTANQTIYVYLPGGDDPRSSGKVGAWLADAGGTAFRVSANNVRVSSGKIDCWIVTTTANTYWGFQLNGVTGCTVEDMVGDSLFYHSFGATGGVCVNNVFRNIRGLTIQRGTDSHLVQYCNSGTLSGCSFSDCEIHLSGLRDYNGDPLAVLSSNPIKGLAGHTGVSGAIGASGLVYDRVEFIDYADEHALGGTQMLVFSGGNGSGPSDRYDAATYQIRMRDCFGFASIIGQCQDDGHLAMERCKLFADGTTSGGISQSLMNVAAGGSLLLEATTMVGELTATSNDVVLRVSDKTTFSNSSVMAAGATNGVIFGGAAADVVAVQSLFAREIAGALCKGGTMPLPVFTGCWYDVLISDTAFGTAASYNTQAEWTSLVDATGVYDVDLSAEFVDLPTLEPRAGSALRTTRSRINTRRPTGVNGKPYAGNPGAWQYGAGGNRTRTRSTRVR